MTKAGGKLTVEVNARPKEFLRSWASHYGCELIIKDEERFRSGFLGLTEMITIWFIIEGSNAKECYAEIARRFEEWKAERCE